MRPLRKPTSSSDISCPTSRSSKRWATKSSQPSCATSQSISKNLSMRSAYPWLKISNCSGRRRTTWAKNSNSSTYNSPKSRSPTTLLTMIMIVWGAVWRRKRIPAANINPSLWRLVRNWRMMKRQSLVNLGNRTKRPAPTTGIFQPGKMTISRRTSGLRAAKLALWEVESESSATSDSASSSKDLPSTMEI